MIIAVCIDGRNGILFNRRRQSQDRAQREDLLAYCGGRKLWVSPYSAGLFPPDRVLVDEDFLTRAEEGDLCFVEDRPLLPVEDQIEAVVLYRWNRAYPADAHLDLDLTGYGLEETTEFPGSSHEKITREIYRRQEAGHAQET